MKEIDVRNELKWGGVGNAVHRPLTIPGTFLAGESFSAVY